MSYNSEGELTDTRGYDGYVGKKNFQLLSRTDPKLKALYTKGTTKTYLPFAMYMGNHFVIIRVGTFADLSQLAQPLTGRTLLRFCMEGTEICGHLGRAS